MCPPSEADGEPHNSEPSDDVVSLRPRLAVTRYPPLSNMSKTEQRPAEPVTLRAALGEVINGIFSKLTSPSTFNVLCTGFLAASLLIFSLLSSIIASIYFYNTFIPPLSVSRPVFLQYGAGVPFGSVQLGPSVLSSGQSYIVFLELEAPASQRNLDVGAQRSGSIICT